MFKKAERSKMDIGYEKIDGVINAFKRMVDELVAGRAALEEHKTMNDQTIVSLCVENKEIEAKMEESKTYEDFLKAKC